MRLLDEALPNSQPLILGVHGEIGKIAAIGIIGDGARDPYQAACVARRHNEICMTQHLIQPAEVLRWTPLSERRGNENCLELRSTQTRFEGVFNRHELFAVPGYLEKLATRLAAALC